MSRNRRAAARQVGGPGTSEATVRSGPNARITVGPGRATASLFRAAGGWPPGSFRSGLAGRTVRPGFITACGAPGRSPRNHTGNRPAGPPGPQLPVRSTTKSHRPERTVRQRHDLLPGPPRPSPPGRPGQLHRRVRAERERPACSPLSVSLPLDSSSTRRASPARPPAGRAAWAGSARLVQIGAGVARLDGLAGRQDVVGQLPGHPERAANTRLPATPSGVGEHRPNRPEVAISDAVLSVTTFM